MPLSSSSSLSFSLMLEFLPRQDSSQIHDYIVTQPDLTARMRSILVDWLIEVHRKFELMPETLYLAINVVDRFLSLRTASRRELQLVGIGSMLIASKYEEIWAPEVVNFLQLLWLLPKVLFLPNLLGFWKWQVNDFVCISDNAYVKEQILVMEKTILEKLEWLLTVPTPYVFLVRYIKASVQSDKEVCINFDSDSKKFSDIASNFGLICLLFAIMQMENMVFFLAELGLTHYPIVTSYRPSVIAASAVYAARRTLDKSPFWTETLKHHTGYSEDQLK